MSLMRHVYKRDELVSVSVFNAREILNVPQSLLHPDYMMGGMTAHCGWRNVCNIRKEHSAGVAKWT